MSKMQLFELFNFYRIRDWLKNLGICLLAIILPSSGINFYSLLPLIQFSLAYSYAFSINNFYDYKIDREKNLIWKKFKHKYSDKFLIFLSFIPLLILLPIVVFDSLLSLIFLILFLFLFTIYSVPPLRLKRNFLFSVPINALSIGAFSFFGSYFFVVEEISFKAIIFSVILTLLIAIYEIVHQISHMKEDKKCGIKSFSIIFGIRKSVNVIVLFQLLVFITAMLSLLTNFKDNIIFLGSIVFSVLRIQKIKNWMGDFSKLRTGIFGCEEVFYYFVITLLSSSI